MTNKCEIYIKFRLSRNLTTQKVIRLFYVTKDTPQEIAQNLLSKSKFWPRHKYGINDCWEIDMVANSLLKDVREDYRLTTFNHLNTNCACIIDCNLKKIKCFEAEYDLNHICDDNLKIELKKELPF